MAWLVVIPFNYVQNLSPWLNVAVLVFGLAAWWLWLESRRGRMRPVTLFVTFMAVLNGCWFINGGSTGSVPYYFLDAILLPAIFARGWLRASLLASSVANVAALHAIEARLPGWLVPFQTPADRHVDLVTGFVICAVAAVMIVAVVVRGYLDERERLVEANARLLQSLDEVRTLRGLLPICSWCRKVRTDEGLWTQVEEYVARHTQAEFTHGMCPECYEHSQKEIASLPFPGGRPPDLPASG